MSSIPDQDPTLRDLLRVFDRRRRILVLAFLIFVFFAVVVCVVTTRRYTASSTIQLQKSSDSLGLDDLMGAASGGASDTLSVNVDLQTQADILQSDTLALKVVKELNLEQNGDFRSHFNPFGWLMGLLSPAGPSESTAASFDDSPSRQRNALATFQGYLKVKVIAGTRLIEVDYTNQDPKVASAVVNHLVQALVDYSFQTKFKATNDVSEWLEGQLGDLRKQTEDLQSKVVALQQGSGIFGVGGTDPEGKPVIFSPVLDRLQASTAQLSQAQMNRVLKQSVYEVAKTGNAELISQLSGTSMGGASQGITNSLTLVQSLRTQEATLKSQVDQDSSQFGSAYPKLIEERAALDGVQRSIQDEIGRLSARAKNDSEIAVRAEDGARRTYDADRSAAEKLNDKSIEYAILSKEADQSQELYRDLLKRLKEAGIVEGLHSSNITMVNPGRPPAKPSKPQVPLYLALGVFLGGFFGGCTALAVEAIDNKIQGTEEIEAMHLPMLGIVPAIEDAKRGEGPILLDSNYSAFGEAIRSLRSTLLISRSGRPPQVILMTSGSPGEGKSTLTLNLAASLAQFNKKVLIVEGDMRRPVLARRLRIEGKNGLSVLLAGDSADVEFKEIPNHPHLYILPAGPVPPYPSELLGSQRMQALIESWRQSFDFILVDSPPVLPVTDAQLLEQFADATVLIARSGVTPRIALQRAYKLLQLHSKDTAKPAIGIVLNYISLHSAAYYGYYGYYGGKKYGYDNQEDRDANV
ncbi:polysaccharide biosynthesis tyrosine autokinase [Acidobacterium sp. S8]|uniref:GumC family protein n=1 Tax=Acidobacterium sp. S8 TaxID=1641854 RepID=UPI00131ADCEF|nr:polysaccharide biosynthesis tyrosine autokinase [Acidobacterium sp. S8]